MRTVSFVPFVLFALFVSPAKAGAQVGHDPAQSPYRSLRYGQFVGVMGGYFNGSGGSIGAAPHHGPTLALRYDFLGAGTMTLGIAATVGRLNRFVIDPTKPIETARTQTKVSLGMIEAILQFNVTGGKTWHGIAPFVSAGLGLLRTNSMGEDNTGFKFRTRFVITPAIGTRLFLSERFFLKLEARSPFWSVTYPATYRETPASDPTKPPVLTTSLKEWVTSGWYTVGMSYAFHRPF